MTTLLLAGGTGLVGSFVLEQALADVRVNQLVALTRRPLPAHPKLVNPVVDFEQLPADAAWWRVDAAICCLGTTIGKAGSQAAFRRVDYDYPLMIAQRVRAHGARGYVLVSAMGADAGSRIFYNRTKGELEVALAGLGFPSLSVLRPGLIGGDRQERRGGERLAGYVLGRLDPILPARFRIVPAERIAHRLLEVALTAAAGHQVIESQHI